MVYNLTGIIQNSTGFVAFMQGVNEHLVFGALGLVMLISICMVLMFGFYFVTQDVKRSVSATAFIAFGLSIFLTAMSLLSTQALLITVIGAAAAIAITFRD